MKYWVSSFFLLSFSNHLYSQVVAVPYEFSSGGSISASQMNENFNYLESMIQTINNSIVAATAPDNITLEYTGGQLKLRAGGINASHLSAMGASSGEVMKWNGSAWVPQPDNSGGAPIVDNTTIWSNAGTLEVKASGINSGHITDGTLTSADFTDNTFSGIKLVDNSVSGNKIMDNTIPGIKIAPMGATPTQVLKWDGTTWAPAADAGGISSLNGSMTGTQTFAFGYSGVTPDWSTMGSVHTLNIPMANIATVTAGLISNGDYQNFSNKLDPTSPVVTGNLTLNNPPVAANHAVNKQYLMDYYIAKPAAGTIPGSVLTYNGSDWVGSPATMIINGGNSYGSIMTIGTNDSFRLDLKANSQTKATLDTNGNFGIGTVAPMGKLHIQEDNYNLTSSTLRIDASFYANATGEQTGINSDLNIHQTGNASYTGFKMNVTETQVGSGTKKLMEFKVNNDTKFMVDSRGVVKQNWVGFMAGFSSNYVKTCTNFTPPAAPGDFEKMNPTLEDFDTTNSFTTGTYMVQEAGVYEIDLDMPFTPSGSTNVGIEVKIKVGAQNYYVPVGVTSELSKRFVKRLAVGDVVELYVACKDTNNSNMSIFAANFLFGARKL